MNEFVTRLEWNGMMTVLERIEAKLESHDRYFHAINSSLGSMDKRFDAMDKRFDAMDKRFDRLEETVRHQGVLHERLESKVHAVIEVLGTKASKTELAAVDAKVDALDAKLDVVIELVRK